MPQRPLRHSLHLRLIGIILLVISPFVVLEVGRSINAHLERQKTQSELSQSLAVSLIGHHERSFLAAQLALATLANAPAVRGTDPQRCMDALVQASERHNGMFVNIARALPDGRVECAHRFSPAQVPTNAMGALERALVSAAPATGAAARSQVHGYPILPLAQPILGDDGQVRAVLMAGVSLNWMERAIEADDRLKGAQVLMTDATGTLLAAQPPQPDLLGERLPRWSIEAQNGADASGSTLLLSLPEADQRLYGFAASPDGLNVAVGLPRLGLEDDVRLRILTSAWFFLSAVALALLISRLFIKAWFLTPLKPLQQAAERISGGNFEDRLGPPYSGPDEIRDLARAFDYMTNSIAERELDLMNSQTQLLVRRQSEERYRTLVDQSPQAIIVLSGGQVVFANDRALILFGAEHSAELVGTPLEDLVTAVSLASLEKALAPAYAGITAPTITETTLCRLDGVSFIAEITAVPVHYNGQSALHVVIRDITARKEMEAHMTQASRLTTLNELAAGLAHELSQPLNILRMASEGMESASPLPLPAPVTERLRLIAEQAKRMGELIDTMRVFSHSDPGPPLPFDAVDATRAACALMTPTLEQAGIAFDVYIDSGEGIVLGRRIHVEQIVLNLLTNARDAVLAWKDSGEAPTPWGPQVYVTARTLPQEKAVVIMVGDNGPGIPSDRAERIFDPFYTTKAPGKGSGLGLSISFSLAEAMGGTLTMVRPDKASPSGASFVLRLPLYSKIER